MSHLALIARQNGAKTQAFRKAVELARKTRLVEAAVVQKRWFLAVGKAHYPIDAATVRRLAHAVCQSPRPIGAGTLLNHVEHRMRRNCDTIVVDLPIYRSLLSKEREPA